MNSRRTLSTWGVVVVVVTTLAAKLEAPAPFHNTSLFPTADTTCGPVRGRRVSGSGVDGFYGIKYATLTNRWTAPVSLPDAGACWEGLFDARSDLIQCVGIGGIGTEDCLTLNVLAPAEASSPLPVMVFFHGGDLTMGATDEDDFRLLAAEGVVVVDVNYRLFIDGFMSISAMSAESGEGGPQGAWGFLDMISSLKWVQQNIAGFGGDAVRETVSLRLHPCTIANHQPSVPSIHARRAA